MFVRLPRRRSASGAGAPDDAVLDHLLAEVFGSVEDPEPIDADLTEEEAQDILDGFRRFMAGWHRERAQDQPLVSRAADDSNRAGSRPFGGLTRP